MSDPLSVAGTAGGIASLGIEVCKGLVNYLTSLQGRNQDIADGLSTVRALLPSFTPYMISRSKLELTGIHQ